MRTRDRLEAILERLDARAGDERVFAKLYVDAARGGADAADARTRAGLSLGPLDGMIVSIKDLFDVAGEPTLAGSVLRRDAEPAAQDAIIVRRLRRAGAVIIGKTHMTEFAFTALGLNPHYGTPGNAADASLIPGGSSSGAGVSAAEGTSDASIGSDTGGSVRVPAALNGIVGFKPTARRIPLDGAFPLSPSLDSIGPLAKTVAQCIAADAVMAGQEFSTLSPLSLSGLRIAVPRGRLFDGLEAGVATAFDRALRQLAAAGATVAECFVDDLLSEFRAATRSGSIASIEGAAIHADWLANGASTPIDPNVSGALGRAMQVPAVSYIHTMNRRRQLVAEMDARLSAFDFIVMPTTPITAQPISEMLADGAHADRVEGLLLRNTQVANQFDLTALSLPMPDMARPAGLSLVARHGHDRRLLAAGLAVEAMLRG
ncbi:amidase [Aminobacter sp. AP02]|uniref:amidase n=1 Tax=Aminobacter sp. AP02 TaxID=2135737 RepID=UPI000D6CA7F9|nr:amidase [Aminobacter sp. AP02]PWK72707.1 aspartyl-tRNA(Asn)/glutamyl-tRNA(Gln) amidotransferase subunit A [Aminobacter sp. AP02]